MYGADAEELVALATLLTDSSAILEKSGRSLTGQLSAAPWEGADAARFRSDWSRSHSPALIAAAQNLAGAAAALRRNAAEQSDASSATNQTTATSSSSAAAAVPPAAGRVATVDEVRAAINGATNPIRAARKVLPGAAGRLEAWAKELETGEHSMAEVQAFLKFKEMMILANSLRATVGSAAESGIAARNAAIEGGVEVALSVGLAVGGKALGESGAGAVTGGADAAAGGTIANVERVSAGTENLVEGVAENVGSYVAKAAFGVETGDPIAIRQAYEARADAFLMQHESDFRASTNDKVTDLAFIRQNAVTEYAGKYEVAVAQGDVAGAFDLGPSWMTTPLSAAMDTLVPYSGTATFGVLGAAEAGANGIAAAQFLNVATDASMDQLARSMVAMRL